MDAAEQRYFAACLVGVSEVFGVSSNSLTKGITGPMDDNLKRARAYVVFFLRSKSASSKPMAVTEISIRMNYPDNRSVQVARDSVEADPEAKALLPRCAGRICAQLNFPLPPWLVGK